MEFKAAMRPRMMRGKLALETALSKGLELQMSGITLHAAAAHLNRY